MTTPTLEPCPWHSEYKHICGNCRIANPSPPSESAVEHEDEVEALIWALPMVQGISFHEHAVEIVNNLHRNGYHLTPIAAKGMTEAELEAELWSERLFVLATQMSKNNVTVEDFKATTAREAIAFAKRYAAQLPTNTDQRPANTAQPDLAGSKEALYETCLKELHLRGTILLQNVGDIKQQKIGTNFESALVNAHNALIAGRGPSDLQKMVGVEVPDMAERVRVLEEETNRLNGLFKRLKSLTKRHARQTSGVVGDFWAVDWNDVQDVCDEALAGGKEGV